MERGRLKASRGKTGCTKHQNGGVWLGDWGESNFLAWVAGEMVEPFAGLRTLGKELSWRAETLSSALVVSEMLVGSQSRRAGGTLSARTEVDLEAVNANHVLFLLHSLGPNMCLRQLLQSSQLQRAWRAAFLKHVQGRHPGAWRWTHSGGGPYRAVIFDMGGVLLPSPGRVAAGESSFSFTLGDRGAWGRGKEGGEGR